MTGCIPRPESKPAWVSTGIRYPADPLFMGLSPRKIVLFVAVDCCLLLAGVYWFVTEKLVVNSRRSRSACPNMLRQIEGAKGTWALERNIRTNATPTEQDIFGPDSYIAVKLNCPEGGTLSIGDLDHPASCTINLHSQEAGDVYVTGEDGQPIADAKVVYRGKRGAYRRVVTDDKGFAQFDAWVLDDSPRVEVSKSGWHSATVSGTNRWPARLVLRRK
jgi:hypothetical protein